MVVIDEIDSSILELLRIDSHSTAIQISNDLSKKGISFTSRSVLNRIARLEKNAIILGYTVRLNSTLFEPKHSVLILLKFVPSCNNDEIDKLSSILCNSPNCFFATILIGRANGYDYAYHLVYDTKHQFDMLLTSRETF